MISLFQAIVALVLLGLGLGALYYFKIRKSPEKPQEDTEDDIDPLEDVEPEPADPVKTTPVVADEPDTNTEPEIIIISKPEDEDKPVQPTPTTSPAEPLIPTKPKPVPAPKPTPAPKPQPVTEPEEPTPTTTPAKPLVPDKPVLPPEPEFRMGWPDGTRWNIRGTTGNDRQRCNDICKSLGYNYFTHNPPPHDGGCGCSRSGLKLSQLNMTDHVNAKTRRVV